MINPNFNDMNNTKTASKLYTSHCLFFGFVNYIQVGGAIYIKNANFIFEIELSTFHKCETKVEASSTYRIGKCGGGAIFLDVNNGSIKNLKFSECKCISYGASLYISAPLGKNVTACCISEILSESEISHIIDKDNSNYNEINFTFPITSHNSGSLHFGTGTEKSDCRFVTIDSSLYSYSVQSETAFLSNILFSRCSILGHIIRAYSNTVLNVYNMVISLSAGVKLISADSQGIINIFNSYLGETDISGAAIKSNVVNIESNTRVPFYCDFLNKGISINIFQTRLNMLIALTNFLNKGFLFEYMLLS